MPARESPKPSVLRKAGKLNLYVGGVVAASAGALLAFSAAPAELISRNDVLIWLIACLAAEFLWLETIGGEATDSMASTVNLAVIYLFAPGLSVWIVGLSVFFATKLLQKRNLVKSVFGFSQMVLTTLVAGAVFKLAGGGTLELEDLRNPVALWPCLAAGVTYSLVNPGLVSVAVALEKDVPVLETWKTNYGYRNSIFSSLALFALSPLLLTAYLAVGFWGILLFFLPMMIVKNQNKEYIEVQRKTQELQRKTVELSSTNVELHETNVKLNETMNELKRATDALIHHEKMAAKGEMAAQIAHELHNYLQIFSGRAQLLQVQAARAEDSGMARDAQIILDQVGNMSVLVRGLLDFSHVEVKPQMTNLNDLVSKTVDFLKPQNSFDRIDIRLDLDPGIESVWVDPGQLQVVLINLVKNAADAILGIGRKEGVIRITSELDDGGSQVHLLVDDDGPGIPDSLVAKVLDPLFTTKADGHGFGLSTCDRIIKNHGGQILPQKGPLGGARFHILLPKERRSAAAA